MTRLLQNLTDDALIPMARAGDDAAVTELVARYLPMIRRRASRYFLPGMEAEDVVQEGLIGLLKQLEELRSRIRTVLSGFEQRVLTLYLSGHSYLEISQLLRTTPKAVDNALQRVRRKLRSV